MFIILIGLIASQKKDVAGNWVFDSEVTGKSTDNGGMASLDLTPGQYAIQFRRTGENENTYLFNINVEEGKITNIVK